jgi:hypothetical protein
VVFKIFQKNPMSNLTFWNTVKETKPQYTKPYQDGDKELTSINPQYNIMKATEAFGMYGKEWGVENLNYETTYGVDGSPLVVSLDADFWYKHEETKHSFPVSSEMDFWSGKGIIAQNVRKSLLTDVTGKALSKLGFNADIYLGQYDDPSYVDGQKLKHTLNNVVFNNEALKAYADTVRAHLQSGETPQQIKENILKKYRSIDKRTEAILKTLTVETIDETIARIA